MRMARNGSGRDPMTAETQTPDRTLDGGAMLLPDGRLSAVKDAPIGGQAVLEGVMMRGVRTWAVAVRKPVEENGHHDDDHHAHVAIAPTVGLDGAVTLPGEHLEDASGNGALGEIEVHTESFDPWIKRHRLLRMPIVRGVAALVESLKIGFRALGLSANAQLGEEEEELSGKAWGATIFLSLLFAVALFFVLPVTIANFWKDSLGSSIVFVIVEKLIRISIFIGYLWVI